MKRDHLTFLLCSWFCRPGPRGPGGMWPWVAPSRGLVAGVWEPCLASGPLIISLRFRSSMPEKIYVYTSKISLILPVTFLWKIKKAQHNVPICDPLNKTFVGDKCQNICGWQMQHMQYGCNEMHWASLALQLYRTFLWGWVGDGCWPLLLALSQCATMGPDPSPGKMMPWLLKSVACPLVSPKCYIVQSDLRNHTLYSYPNTCM